MSETRPPATKRRAADGGEKANAAKGLFRHRAENSLRDQLTLSSLVTHGAPSKNFVPTCRHFTAGDIVQYRLLLWVYLLILHLL